MNKEGGILEHSREKLLIYEKYLIEYLSVLTNQSYYNNIFIWDIFAGRGKDNKGNKGSAVIAAEVIEDFKSKKNIILPKKNIILHLNELNENYCKELKANLKDYEHFTKIYQSEAEAFLKEVINFNNEIKNNDLINFFFIDPYGYTQYSTETLKNLLNLEKSEYLIFIPTNNIYRFTGALDNNPAAKFVLDLGFKKRDFNNPECFIEELQKTFKSIVDTDFVYSYKINNSKVSNSFHHLFFITKHIKGAEKFLTAKNIVKEELPKQIILFDNVEKEKEISTYLKNWRSNLEIYKWGIQNALLPKEIRSILLELENKYQLEIQVSLKKRKKGDFYLTNKQERIKVKLK